MRYSGCGMGRLCVICLWFVCVVCLWLMRVVVVWGVGKSGLDVCMRDCMCGTE